MLYFILRVHQRPLPLMESHRQTVGGRLLGERPLIRKQWRTPVSVVGVLLPDTWTEQDAPVDRLVQPLGMRS